MRPTAAIAAVAALLVTCVVSQQAPPGCNSCPLAQAQDLAKRVVDCAYPAVTPPPCPVPIPAACCTCLKNIFAQAKCIGTSG